MKTRYGFANAVNGFFEFPTENARRILPAHLEPVEVHHGSSILTVTAFEFSDSPVGAYGEIALSIIVSPRIMPGEAMPRAAMYPFQVGTTTAAARKHGTERWKLPHHPADLAVTFERAEHRVKVSAAAGGRPILELDIHHPRNVPWQEVEHLYQTFAQDARGSFLSPLVMRGYVGSEIRTDRVETPVREVVIPLAAFGGGRVRASWWPWSAGRIVLTAADLRAFEAVAGETGLRLEHPAALVFRVWRADLDLAREFVSEIEMALADRALLAAQEPGRLPPS